MMIDHIALNVSMYRVVIWQEFNQMWKPSVNAVEGTSGVETRGGNENGVIINHQVQKQPPSHSIIVIALRQTYHSHKVVLYCKLNANEMVIIRFDVLVWQLWTNKRKINEFLVFFLTFWVKFCWHRDDDDLRLFVVVGWKVRGKWIKETHN